MRARFNGDRLKGCQRNIKPAREALLVVKIQGRLRKPRAYCLIWSIVVLGGNFSATTPTPPLLLTRQGIAHAVADASNLSGELMTAWNQIPPSVFSAMWADTGDRGYISRYWAHAAVGSKDFGRNRRTVRQLCRTATMMMTGADERELENLKRRVTKLERRLITLAAFTVSTFGLWLALIIYQVFL